MNTLRHDTFLIQMDRLRSTFGKGAFGDERAKIINRFCANLTDNEFIRLTNFFLESRKAPPLPIDFRDGVHKAISNRLRAPGIDGVSKGEPIQINCDLCSDAGIVIVRKHETMSEVFAMACKCGLGGTESGWNLPRYDAEFFGNYVIVDTVMFFSKMVEKRGLQNASDHLNKIIFESVEHWGTTN